MCLVALIVFFFPRIFLAVLWVSGSDWTKTAFQGYFLAPILGWLFLPYTTCVWMGGQVNSVNGVWTTEWSVFFVIVLVLEILAMSVRIVTRNDRN